MEKVEREFLLRYLAETRERLLDVVADLSKEQQRFRPGEDRWSVAECVEHITIVEKGVLRMVQGLVREAPPSQSSTSLKNDDNILSCVPKRPPLFNAPTETLPGKRWTDFEQLWRRFEAARERTLRFAGVTQSDLRRHSFEHSYFGALDCYQWLLFVGAHSERHARQAEEIMADPDFPRQADSAIA